MTRVAVGTGQHRKAAALWVCLLVLTGSASACAHVTAEEALQLERVDPADAIADTIYDEEEVGVAPEVTNRMQVSLAMRDLYPARLRNQGVGGTVDVELIVAPTGTVVIANLHRSSGHVALDLAGVRVARRMEFSPGRVDGEPVYTRLVIPFVFQAR